MYQDTIYFLSWYAATTEAPEMASLNTSPEPIETGT